MARKDVFANIENTTEFFLEWQKDYWNHFMLNGGIRCHSCRSRDGLKLQHKVGLDFGGDNEPSNVEIRCRNCRNAEDAQIERIAHRLYQIKGGRN